MHSINNNNKKKDTVITFTWLQNLKIHCTQKIYSDYISYKIILFWTLQSWKNALWFSQKYEAAQLFTILMAMNL